MYCTVELDILIGVGDRWGDCECMPSGEVQCGCFVGDILIRPGERWGDACRFCECLPSEELKCEMNGKYFLSLHLSRVVNHEMCYNFAGKKLELFYLGEKGCNYKFNMSTLCVVYAHTKYF